MLICTYLFCTINCVAYLQLPSVHRIMHTPKDRVLQQRLPEIIPELVNHFSLMNENGASLFSQNVVLIYGLSARRFLCLRANSSVYVAGHQEVCAQFLEYLG